MLLRRHGKDSPSEHSQLASELGLRPGQGGAWWPGRPAAVFGAGGPHTGPWAGEERRRTAGTQHRRRAHKPRGLQHLRLACTGCCYLRTMSLISFTELSSLLKSCVAAGPLEAVAGQICSSRRLLSSLLMASRKANLFLICWMEST